MSYVSSQINILNSLDLFKGLKIKFEKCWLQKIKSQPWLGLAIKTRIFILKGRLVLASAEAELVAFPIDYQGKCR